MLGLAIDTAASECSACLYDSAAGSVLSSRADDIGKGHAERLMDQIGEVLAEAGKGYSDIDRIAVSVGPGSFTGVRVGVAAARGLALALGIPAVGVTTLESLAADAVQTMPGPALAVIDARRGQVYAQLFAADGKPASDPQLLSCAEAAVLAQGASLLAGTGAPLLAASGASLSAVLTDRATGLIETVARIGAARVPGAAPVPLYLRGPDAKPQAGFAVARRESA